MVVRTFFKTFPKIDAGIEIEIYSCLKYYVQFLSYEVFTVHIILTSNDVSINKILYDIYLLRVC